MQKMIGTVPCDFINAQQLADSCHRWLSEPQAQLRHIITLNAGMVIQAAQQSHFRQIIWEADLVVPDGAGLFWAADYLQRQDLRFLSSLLKMWRQPHQTLTGRSIIRLLAEICQNKQQSMFLLGSTKEDVKRATQKLQQEFPHLRVAGVGGQVYQPNGPAEILAQINQSKATALCVAYGSPKQSLWIHHHRKLLPHLRIAVGVGGGIAQISGKESIAPDSWQEHNIEWLWRLLQEPKRLPRIWRATISFPLFIHKSKKNQRESAAS